LLNGGIDTGGKRDNVIETRKCRIKTGSRGRFGDESGDRRMENTGDEKRCKT